MHHALISALLVDFEAAVRRGTDETCACLWESLPTPLSTIPAFSGRGRGKTTTLHGKVAGSDSGMRCLHILKASGSMQAGKPEWRWGGRQEQANPHPSPRLIVQLSKLFTGY